MTPLSNGDGILLVLFLDAFLAGILAAHIDRYQWDTPLAYQEFIGFGCAGPAFFFINFIGIIVLILLHIIGVLGPWWSWLLGIASPYLLILLMVIFSKKDKTKTEVVNNDQLPVE